MPTYETPGVYYERMDASPPAIGAVRTDVAGFVGIASRGLVDQPTPVQSWRQFRANFGSFIGSGYLAYVVKGFFENGGGKCYVVRVANRDVATSASVAALTPPGPRGWPLLGNLPAYRRDPLGFLSGLARDYGDVSAFRFGPWTVTLLNHPDLIRDVLVTHQRNFAKGAGIELMKPLLGEGLLTSEREFHLRQRRLAQPAFHRKRIAAYGAAMVEEGARARDSAC